METANAKRRDRSLGLAQRGEWLAPRDIEEALSVSHTTAWRICRGLPHVRVGKRGIRVARSDVLAALRDGSI